MSCKKKATKGTSILQREPWIILKLETPHVAQCHAARRIAGHARRCKSKCPRRITSHQLGPRTPCKMFLSHQESNVPNCWLPLRRVEVGVNANCWAAMPCLPRPSVPDGISTWFSLKRSFQASVGEQCTAATLNEMNVATTCFF